MYILSIGANIKGLWSLWPPIKYLRGPPPKLMSIAIRMGHVLCNVISCVGWVFLPPKKKCFIQVGPPGSQSTHVKKRAGSEQPTQVSFSIFKVAGLLLLLHMAYTFVL